MTDTTYHTRHPHTHAHTNTRTHTKQGDGRKEVTDTTYHTETFDEVVFACHPDQALAMLEGAALVSDWLY